MLRLKDMNLKPKLIMLFLLVGIIPLAVGGFWATNLASDALMDSSYSQLTALREVKATQIENYFAERQGDLQVLVNTVASLRERAFSELEAVHANLARAAERYLSENNVAPAKVVPGSAVELRMNSIVRECTGLLETEETYFAEGRNGPIEFTSDILTMGDGNFVFCYDITDIAPE